MIADNEFVLNRSKVFKNSKYIIVARLEKAGMQDIASVEGRVEELKQTFQSQLTEQIKETRSLIE